MGGLYFCSTKNEHKIYKQWQKYFFYFLLIKCQTFCDGTRHHSSIRHVTTTEYKKDKIFRFGKIVLYMVHVRAVGF